jgi:hypothetical protein
MPVKTRKACADHNEQDEGFHRTPQFGAILYASCGRVNLGRKRASRRRIGGSEAASAPSRVNPVPKRAGTRSAFAGCACARTSPPPFARRTPVPSPPHRMGLGFLFAPSRPSCGRQSRFQQRHATKSTTAVAVAISVIKVSGVASHSMGHRFAPKRRPLPRIESAPIAAICFPSKS